MPSGNSLAAYSTACVVLRGLGEGDLAWLPGDAVSDLQRMFRLTTHDPVVQRSRMPQLQAFNRDLLSQVKALEAILRRSAMMQAVLDRAERLHLPQWYLGAGGIAQTVWNYLGGNDLTTHIQDLDLVYFEAEDLREESERQHVENVRVLLQDIPVPIDVKNQARVHVWYAAHFGYPILPYHSVEEAINTWPTTATCVGIRVDAQGFQVYAPYGLNDLFRVIVRPNKVQITEAIYQQKVTRWKACWPNLHIITW